jgi:hypothetical protein
MRENKRVTNQGIPNGHLSVGFTTPSRMARHPSETGDFLRRVDAVREKKK